MALDDPITLDAPSPAPTARPPVAQLATEQLEHQMLTLAGHLAAATCSFLELVGEYDARRSWESWECLSCAHWLNWRCGVGMVAAREQVRVARRLRELPVVRDAFAAGSVSYSKVRAITRVARPDNEAKLVELARCATASQLERACAALRRHGDLGADEQEHRDAEELAHLRRSLRWQHDPDTGDLVVRLRIPAGVAAESFRAAVVAATDDADHETDLECRRLDAALDLVSAGAGVDSSLAGRAEVVVHVTPGAQGDLGPEWPVTTASGCPTSLRTLAQLCCDSGVRSVLDLPASGDPLAPLAASSDLGRHRRFPSAALRRAVQRRDRGTCRFPGCDRRHRLHVHHIVWWEHGGGTDRDNLLLLCPKHHRAVHVGEWSLSGTATTASFERGGHGVPDAAPPMHGSLALLVDAHRRSGIDVVADGAGSHWQGDHIDWDCFFAAFEPTEHCDDSAESPGPLIR